MLTRNSPSRRTRLFASAGVVLIAAGAGFAAWAAQPEQVVVEAQVQQPAPPAPPAPRAPLPPLDHGAAVPAPDTPPAAPTPPAPPVPSARDFAALQAPEAPPVAPPPPVPPVPAVSAVPGVAATPAVPGVAPTPRPPAVPAPLAAPAPAPAPAPQQLSQAERDELMRRLEVQRREMDALVRELEELRARTARQQSGEAAARDVLREQKTAQDARERLVLELVEKQRATTGDLKLNLPKTTIEDPAVKKMLEEAYRNKEAAARAPAMDEFLIRNADGTIRNKIVLGQVDKSLPFDSDVARARAAAEKRKAEQAARAKQKPE